jgi:DNA adenine methylase
MWAGGKTRLIKHYAPVWPDNDGLAYVEPFFGGGAVFCWQQSLHPHFRAHLGDVNAELIGVLRRVRRNPTAFVAATTALAQEVIQIQDKEGRKKWFYAQREIYWAGPTPERLYVLMRLGFNGIWQTCAASNGKFGTPAGLLNQRSVSQIVDGERVRLWSLALQRVTLHPGSYESMQLPAERSLIYLDPPYRDSFTTYGTGFSDGDQKGLAAWYRARVEEEHVVLLTNRCVDGDSFFEDLLGDIADFHYFDVVYTAGRRKKVGAGHEAKAAREFIAISKSATPS